MVAIGVQVALYGMVGVWSTCSNVLVIAVLLYNSLLTDYVNIFLLSMAMNDILVTVTGMPLTIYNLLHGSQTPLCKSMCPYFGYVVLSLFVSSVYHLPAIALQRYLCVIKREFYTKHVTRRSCIIAISCVWLFSFLISLPPLLGWGEINYDEVRSWCFVLWSKTGPYLAFVNICAFPVPLGVMVVCYYKVSKFYREAHKKIASYAPSATQDAEKRRITKEQRLTLMLIFVVIWFFFCYFFYLLGAYGEAFKLFQYPRDMEFFVLLIAYCNSIVNFWLYAYMGSKFRRGVRKLFCLRRGDSYSYDSSNTREYSSTAKEASSRVSSPIPERQQIVQKSSGPKHL